MEKIKEMFWDVWLLGSLVTILLVLIITPFTDKEIFTYDKFILIFVISIAIYIKYYYFKKDYNILKIRIKILQNEKN